MSETRKAAAMAAFVSIACGLFCMAVVSLRESRSEAVAVEAHDIALEAKDEARVGSWHLLVAATGPHVGMPVTWRPPEGGERPGVLLMKVGNTGWLLAVFDRDTREWSEIGPMLEGTREELGTWTPAICGGMRAGFTGVGHSHAGHGSRAGVSALNLDQEH